MGEINFNVTDNSYPYDCLYFDTNYGYRACLNGKRLDIADIKTVIALKNQFGLPELNISEKDVKRFEKCIYWNTEKKKTCYSKSFSKYVSWCSLKLRYSAINSLVFRLSGISSFGIISLEPIEP